MKKIIALVCAIAMAASLSACSITNGNPNSGSSSDASSSSSSSSSSDTSSSSSSKTSIAGRKQFDTVDDYLHDPAVKKTLDASLSKTSGGNQIEYYAEGDDTMVYKFTFNVHVDDSQLPKVQAKLESGINKQDSLYEDAVKELKDNTNQENPKVKVMFCNDDGTVMYSKVYQ